MNEELYSEKGWVETLYDGSKGVIRVKWFNYTSRVHVRRACEAQLEAMQKYKATIIVSDAFSAIGIPYPQDQEWFIEHLYPRTLELGLQAVISILPKNPIARSGTKTWNDTAKKSGLPYIEVNSLEEAETELHKMLEISGT
jgi:hypothetical protein